MATAPQTTPIEQKVLIPVPSAPSRPDPPLNASTSPLNRFRWVVEGIFDYITPYDVRCLVQFLDARNRAGDFHTVFPTHSTELNAAYLQFFEKPRYANLLQVAYIDKYGTSEEGEFIHWVLSMPELQLA